MEWIKTHEDRIVNISHVEDVFLNENELSVDFSLKQDVIRVHFTCIEGAKDYFDGICRLLEIRY